LTAKKVLSVHSVPISNVQGAVYNLFQPQEIILESFENIEEVANILETNFHKLTETEVAVAYSALHHLSPGVTKGLGEKIHRMYGFRL